jgi:hypothetical protein
MTTVKDRGGGGGHNKLENIEMFLADNFTTGGQNKGRKQIARAAHILSQIFSPFGDKTWCQFVKSFSPLRDVFRGARYLRM